MNMSNACPEFSSPPAAASAKPSSALLHAALIGLLGATISACQLDDTSSENDGTSSTNATGSTGSTSTSSVGDSSSLSDQSSTSDSATWSTSDSATSSTSESTSDSSSDSQSDDGTTSTGPEILNEVVGNRTFASLQEDCDLRGGFIQIHAACSGNNACRGFSYGDWNPGVLIEHTCAGINGCNGLSCVVLPADSGKSGKEVYETSLPESGPRSCANCHADWPKEGVDTSKFKVYVLPGSGRTLDNWLEVSAKEQAKIVAFGKSSVLADGTALANMSPYHQLWSRAEIERVVEYIRSDLTPILKEIKISDPE